MKIQNPAGLVPRDFIAVYGSLPENQFASVTVAAQS